MSLLAVGLRAVRARPISMRAAAPMRPMLGLSARRLYSSPATAASTPPKEDSWTVNTELPDPMAERRKLRQSLVAFFAVMLVSFVAIVKYEDANSGVVTSTLYTVRRSPKATEILGENIQFANPLMPWIYGRIHTARGVVDFKYKAVGTAGTAMIHFNARRDPKTTRFVVHEWEIIPEGGQPVSLMEEDFHPFVPDSREEPTMKMSGQ
uniref:ARAD1B00242p n=1 Tax=Blastobotrys adeninivorans TaxID=409370 RepID=A0A060T9M3_BLAAD